MLHFHSCVCGPVHSSVGVRYVAIGEVAGSIPVNYNNFFLKLFLKSIRLVIIQFECLRRLVRMLRVRSWKDDVVGSSHRGGRMPR